MYFSWRLAGGIAMSNYSQILNDLRTELSSSFVEDVFEVRGHSFKLRLLNDVETEWAYSQIDTKTPLGLAVAARRATLAIGIREIDGATPEVLCEELLKSRTDPEIQVLYNESSNSSDILYANMLLETLKEYPPEFIDEIYDGWKKLEVRRSEAQKNLKN